ncbi:hypothetical protein ACHWQZ_G007760 [Mnemiopsis leidyi]
MEHSLTKILFLLIAGIANGVKFQQWERLEGKMKHVSVGALGVWGINSGGTLFRLDGKTWTQIDPSGWLTVSSGGEYIWATRTDHSIRKGDGENWQVVSGGLVQIEASRKNNVWAVNRSNQIYRYNGINWTMTSGRLQQITSGASGVWGTTSGHVTYYRPYTYGDQETTGGDWQVISVTPPMKWVASGDDLVLAIDRSGNLYYRNGINVSQPTGTSWVKVEGVPLLKQVDVYYSVVMAVDTEDNIWSNIIQY